MKQLDRLAMAAALMLVLSGLACSSKSTGAVDAGDAMAETSDDDGQADVLSDTTRPDHAPTPDQTTDSPGDAQDTDIQQPPEDALEGDAEDVHIEIGEHEILQFLETEMLQGTVELPAGTSLAVESLQVVNHLGSVAPDSSGDFELEVYVGDMQLAFVMDSQSRLVLVGFLGHTHPQLNTRSTAAALAYYALGGYLLPPPLNAQLVELLLAADELTALEQSVTDAVVQSGTMGTQEQSIRQQLGQFVQAALADSRDSFLPKILYIDPGPVRSGITLDTSTGVNTITILNEHRRKTWFWVERISYVDASGATVPAQSLIFDGAGPLPGATTTLLASFLDVYQGKVAYAPKSLPPLELGLFPDDAQSTQYRVTAVGAGYGSGDLANLTPEQANMQGYMVYTTIFADFLIPIVINGALPLNKTEIEDFFGKKGFPGTLKDLISVGTNKAWGIAAKADSGDVKGAVEEAVKTITLSGTFRNNVIKLVGYLGSKAGLSSAPDVAENFKEGLGEFLAHADFILTSFDTWVQGSDLLDSEQACIWDIEATASKVSIEPPTSDVQMQKFEYFKAHVLDGEFPEGSLTYHFESTAQHGRIFNSELPEKGSKVITKLDWVWYIADAGTKGSDTLTVEVFVDEEGEQVSLGKAIAQIQITDTYVGSITPFEAQVSPGSANWFTAKIDPMPEEGQLNYHWMNSGKYGHIAGLVPGFTDDVWDSSGSITYNASQYDIGTDTLQVEIYLEKDGQKKLLDKASTTIKVQPPGSGPYKLAADTVATWNLGFDIDDDLTLKLNGVTFYSAGNGEPNGHYPIKLPETTGIGDVLTLEIWEMPCNWQGNHERWSLGDIYLVSTTNAALAFLAASGPWVTIPEPCDYYMAYTVDFTIPF